MIKVCEYCCKEFKAAKKIRRFCSNSCSRKFQSIGKNQLLKCDNCEKEFNRPKCHIRKNNFCSRKCQGDWQSKSNLEEKHPKWKGGVNIRENGRKFIRTAEKNIERNTG